MLKGECHWRTTIQGRKDKPFDDESGLAVLKTIQFTDKVQIHVDTEENTLEELERLLEREWMIHQSKKKPIYNNDEEKAMWKKKTK